MSRIVTTISFLLHVCLHLLPAEQVAGLEIGVSHESCNTYSEIVFVFIMGSIQK